MATVIFYEKPGCGNNTKQKVWLAASGHTVLAKNLLTEKWSAERLRAFFGGLPVEKWFNPAAPKVKSGEIDPSAFDDRTALDLMLAEPLLIRRPLMEVEGVLRVGFDVMAVDTWIGLNDSQPKEEPCPSGQARLPHPNPDRTTSHSTKPASGQVAGYLPEGEGATAALRADLNSCHRSEPCPTPEIVT